MNVASCTCLAVWASWACACAAQEPSAAPSPASFAYVLQAENLGETRAAAVDRLARSGRDWLVLDLVYAEGADGAWTRAELDALRAAQPGRKVLAYLSIGEAEDYRPYWRRAWDANRDGRPDSGAPKWLGEQNPEWKGNYKVRYWQEAWQQLALRGVDEAAARGFDGVYLDLVDAFETFEYDPLRKAWIDDRVNPETGRTYRQDMAAWVGAIAARARQAKPGCLVVPQNGSQLLRQAGYVAQVDAIGIEDLFTEGNKSQPAEHSDGILGDLKEMAAAHKPVLVIEYGSKEKARARSRRACRESGFTLLLTDRALKTLGESGAANEPKE